MARFVINETGILLHNLPHGSFRLCVAWIGNSFRVAVKTTNLNELIFFRSYDFADGIQFKDVIADLKEIVSSDVLFSDVYHDITIGLQGRSELFPKDFQPSPTTHFSEFVNTLDLYVSQTEEPFLIEFYRAFFPNAVYRDLSASWLRMIATISDAKFLFVQIDHHLMSVAYFLSPNKVRLFSTFEFKTVEDFAYFINLVALEVGLDRNETTLFLSGDVIKSSRIFDLAFTYFSKIEFFEHTSIIYSNLFNQYPRHQNIHFFSL